MSFSCATPWTVAHKAPLFLGFPGKNTGVGCHSLLERIFPTGIEPVSPALQADSLPLSHLGSPMEFRATGKQKMIIEAIRMEVIAQRWGLETERAPR